MRLVISLFLLTCIALAAIPIAKAQPIGDAPKDDSLSGNQRTFAGMNFGVGLSLSYSGSKNRKRIENAEVVNGIVRVTEESPAVARVLLETHYLFDKSGDHTHGHGPFVAFQPGTTEIIQSIGLGYMHAFRKNALTTDSWNIGIGYMVEPKVKVLGDGVYDNQPLPAGETQIRYKYTSRYSMFIFSSYTF